MSLAHYLPSLGVGLGYRSELRAGILANREHIDFLEIIADNYLREPGALASLEDLCTLFQSFRMESIYPLGPSCP